MDISEVVGIHHDLTVSEVIKILEKVQDVHGPEARFMIAKDKYTLTPEIQTILFSGKVKWEKRKDHDPRPGIAFGTVKNFK